MQRDLNAKIHDISYAAIVLFNFGINGDLSDVPYITRMHRVISIKILSIKEQTRVSYEQKKNRKRIRARSKGLKDNVCICIHL